MDDVVLDSLPYIDTEYNNEALRAEVERLVQEELAVLDKSQATKSSLPETVELFANNELLRKDLERVERGEPLQAIDTVRFRLEAPPAPTSDDESSSEAFLQSWMQALDNARCQLEHQHNRLINLELLNKFGSNAWRLNTFQLEQAVKNVENELAEIRGAVLMLNKNRKIDQLKGGSTIRALEARWTELVQQVVQVDAANRAFEAHLAQLRDQKESIEKHLATATSSTKTVESSG
ncbi:hypothetical protein HK102_010811 [Quaeritorhiza haematococci]|nr:hypothetical protein HK102_010811 [Quaeritorhiza haematococci]